MRGRTIRQFLIDGIADGRWTCELSNWTGKAYKIPRTYLNTCEDRLDLTNTGVYFLFGTNDETDRQQVYIGEAENILMRMKQHVAAKDFWTECVIFISKDNNLNKAHIKYLENHLYHMAKASNRYEVLNSVVPTESSISEMDRAEMDEFIDNMQLMLSVLGHKVLESSVSKSAKQHDRTFHLQDKAKGRLTSEGFAVLKGSKIAQTVTSSLSQSVINKRDQLFKDKIVNDKGEFTQDWLFSSPSLAAKIIVGYSLNGRDAWKDAKGSSINDIEARENPDLGKIQFKEDG